MVERGDVVATAPAEGWQRLSDRLARYGLLILLLAVAIAVVGGVVVAVAWQPQAEEAPVVDACPNPPCFGGGGLPGVQDLPWISMTLGYGLAILLGLPSLLAGAWDLLRRHWAVGGRRVLTFVGPVLVVGLIEVLPHLLNPCAIPYALGSRNLPGICQANLTWGADVAARYHLLDHALVGGVPLAALYWLALRRWRPALARLWSADPGIPRAR